jgi:hypothetical protein
MNTVKPIKQVLKLAVAIPVIGEVNAVHRKPHISTSVLQRSGRYHNIMFDDPLDLGVSSTTAAMPVVKKIPIYLRAID